MSCATIGCFFIYFIKHCYVTSPCRSLLAPSYYRGPRISHECEKVLIFETVRVHSHSWIDLEIGAILHRKRASGSNINFSGTKPEQNCTRLCFCTSNLAEDLRHIQDRQYNSVCSQLIPEPCCIHALEQGGMLSASAIIALVKRATEKPKMPGLWTRQQLFYDLKWFHALLCNSGVSWPYVARACGPQCCSKPKISARPSSLIDWY